MNSTEQFKEFSRDFLGSIAEVLGLVFDDVFLFKICAGEDGNDCEIYRSVRRSAEFRVFTVFGILIPQDRDAQALMRYLSSKEFTDRLKLAFMRRTNIWLDPLEVTKLSFVDRMSLLSNTSGPNTTSTQFGSTQMQATSTPLPLEKAGHIMKSGETDSPASGIELGASAIAALSVSLSALILCGIACVSRKISRSFKCCPW